MAASVALQLSTAFAIVRHPGQPIPCHGGTTAGGYIFLRHRIGVARQVTAQIAGVLAEDSLAQGSQSPRDA